MRQICSASGVVPPAPRPRLRHGVERVAFTLFLSLLSGCGASTDVGSESDGSNGPSTATGEPQSGHTPAAAASSGPAPGSGPGAVSPSAEVPASDPPAPSASVLLPEEQAGPVIVDVPSSPVEPETCATEHHQAELAPLALFIALDQSNSMVEDGDRWTPVTDALRAFTTAPESQGLWVALHYFPVLADEDEPKCELDNYSTPEITLAQLPGNVDPIAASLVEHHFDYASAFESGDEAEELRSGTPTRPAVEGALQYMQSWLAEHPEHRAAIVLATDGEPTGVCDDNDIDDVALTLERAAQQSPAVLTYVVGIGEIDRLDELASAGGTGRSAFVVDGSGSETQDQFLAALREIRGTALSCEFGLPQPETGRIDPAKVNIDLLLDPAGSALELGQVPSADDCGEAHGWYYDDPDSPALISLCPVSCAAASTDADASIDVALGCETRVIEVR